ncbi:helix-turn-helix domain-containing protein [Nonomuraea sp. NPDC050790]|uniref:helix-turn-helix domain-containing protein n=1 Tax=Nonomuraea sp. NPDC050790 TaxID=3364371 RepID=UPI0037933CD6
MARLFTIVSTDMTIEVIKGFERMANSRQPQMPMDGVTLGTYVRSRREGLGISQRQLAKRVGLSHSYLGRLEANDFAQPGPAALYRIAEALDLEPENLFALAGHTVPEELPSFEPYLRAKYQMSDQAAQELSDYFQFMAERHNIAERPSPRADNHQEQS